MTARPALLGIVLLVACGSDAPPPRPNDAAVAVDAALAKDVAAPTDGPGAEAGSAPDGLLMCAPIAGCTPSAAGVCDHVCQARCGCQQRCAFFNGAAACLP